MVDKARKKNVLDGEIPIETWQQLKTDLSIEEKKQKKGNDLIGYV